jgi:hypothetical protein
MRVRSRLTRCSESLLSAGELQERKITLLLLDDADLLSQDSLQGIISLYDHCRAKAYPVSMVCAGATGHEKWIGSLPAGWSRTLKVCKFRNLTVEMTCALFGGWGTPLTGLAQGVRQKNRDSIGTIKMIHKGTGGNLRRLFYFAKLAALDPVPLSAERVRQIMDQMTTLNAVEER